MTDARLTVGVHVSWVDANGRRRFGLIDEINKAGRVYVAETVEMRGRKIVSVVWFDPDETNRLTVSHD